MQKHSVTKMGLQIKRNVCTGNLKKKLQENYKNKKQK